LLFVIPDSSIASGNDLEFARSGDLDLLLGLAGLGANALNGLDDVLTLDDLAEDLAQHC